MHLYHNDIIKLIKLPLFDEMTRPHAFSQRPESFRASCALTKAPTANYFRVTSIRCYVLSTVFVAESQPLCRPIRLGNIRGILRLCSHLGSSWLSTSAISDGDTDSLDASNCIITSADR